MTFPAVLIPGTDRTVQLSTGATGGTVSCWIDFNQDGDWSDPGEAIVTGVAIGAGTVSSQTFPVPVGAPQGTAPSRCRISSQTGLGVTGEAPDGEVEDHPAITGLAVPGIGVAKSLVSLEREEAQVFEVVFAVRVENLGNVPLTNVQVTENLAATFAMAASYNVLSVQSAEFTVNPGFNGGADTNLLAAGNTLAVGASGTLTLTLRVDSGGQRGPYTNQVTGQGTSPDGTPVTDVSQNGDDADPDDDGDGTDNNEPTVFVLVTDVIEIPTLDVWGLLLLTGLLGVFALRRLRHRA